MDIFTTYATDAVAESEGRWFPLSKTASVLVARTGNPNYLKAMRQRMKDAQVDTSDNSEANEALVTGLVNEAMAETILLGWKGISYKGQPVTYSKKSAAELLSIKDFRKRISAIADTHDSFLVREEAEQGNDSQNA